MNSVPRITLDELETARNAWGAAVARSDLAALLALYDFSVLLFKPTLSASVRIDERGARSYFVGGDAEYPNDQGFLTQGISKVEFRSARGPRLEGGGASAQDMGHYTFTCVDGRIIEADYTFSYHKPADKVLITLHHSSLSVVES